MRKYQIHILRDWNDLIQELPDDAAGILYKGIQRLHTDGTDIVSDLLAQRMQETIATVYDANFGQGRRDVATAANAYSKALQLWTELMVPYYRQEREKHNRGMQVSLGNVRKEGTS